MSENVERLKLVSVGEEFRFDPDATLEQAKGQPFEKLLILGQLDDGDLYILSNANAGESLILMEKVKHQIIFGED